MKIILSTLIFLFLTSCAGTRAPADGETPERQRTDASSDKTMRPGMGMNGKSTGKGMKMMGGDMMRMQAMSDSCRMRMMMIHGMMSRELVALEGGGVALLAGGNLYKYDANLRLQSETEVKMDPMTMQKIMSGMMQGCPMMGKRPDYPGDSQDGTSSPEIEPQPLPQSEPDSAGGSSGTVDHEAHH